MSNNLNVFLGEDDPDDQILFEYALNELSPHYTLYSFCNGEELIHKLHERTHRPDVIFVDINMPLKNGLECVKALRQLNHLDQVPIIILSTSADDFYVNDAYRLKADLYIKKPNLFQELKEILLFCFENLIGQQKKISRKDFVIHEIKSYKKQFLKYN